MTFLRAARPRRSMAPWLVLAASLVLAAAATGMAAASVRAREAARFAGEVQGTRDRIEARLDTYIALLQATAALFAASRDVDRGEFAAYAARLRVRERYPGIQGIGLSRRVAPSEVPALERRLRGEGVPDFHIWPDTARDEYHSIVYLEPLDRRNRAAIGYDMFTEPTRREAMERARDTGAPVASGRVQLVQEIDERKQAGFLIYVPIYAGGAVPADVPSRRAALRGFVYAPFRADDLFEGIFGRDRAPRVAFRIHDGAHPDGAELLHDSRAVAAPDAPPRGRAAARLAALDAPPALADTLTLAVAGRSWTIVVTPTPALVVGAGGALVPIVLVAGLVVSVLLFVLARAGTNAHEHLALTALEMEALAGELRVRNAELAAANRSKSEFLATMSHEIRTPLNAIIGYSQLLELGIAGPVTAEQERQIGRITASGAHLLGLIDDILDLARIEAGRLDVASEAAVVGAAVEAALALVRPQASAKEIVLSMAGEGACDARYLGDEQRVRQILVNLLSNAVKFTPAEGRVRVVCGAADRLPEEVEIAGRGPWVRVTVEDTGIGIAPETMERIFQPFVQGDAGYTRRHSGTGLGLTISRRLARMMGGELAAESAPGEGSRFTLWLPAPPPAAERAAGERPSAAEAPISAPAPSRSTGGDGRESTAARGEG